MVGRPNRIAELRTAAGLTQEGLAQRVDSHPVTISRIENAPLNLKNRTTRRIAGVFGVTVQELANRPEGETVTVRGDVQAGVWRDHAEWPEEDRYEITIPKIPGQEGRPKAASVVRGSSMNELYPDGSTVVWIPFCSQPEEPKPGRRYIVERERHGEFETTLKEYAVDERGREWLLPRTTDPAEKAPILIEAGDGETIRIVGRVIWAARVEEN